MAWVSIHEGVLDHPKTRKLRQLLRCSRHEAVGLLTCLWVWGLKNADREGVIQNASEEDISDGIMYRPASYGQSEGQGGVQSPNTSGRMTLLGALVAAGWVDKRDGGVYALHDWDFWQRDWFKYQDKLETDKKRKRDERAGNKGVLGASSGTSAGQSIGQSTGKSTTNHTNTTTEPNNIINLSPFYSPAGELAPLVQAQGGEMDGKRQSKNPPKINFAQFVGMTNDEYTSLVAKLGEDGAKRCIEILDNYKGSTGKKYASDYRAILNWVVNRFNEEQQRKKPTGNAKNSVFKDYDEKF
jgi:hypothetical protein